jgi:hypothetical protein
MNNNRALLPGASVDRDAVRILASEPLAETKGDRLDQEATFRVTFLPGGDG